MSIMSPARRTPTLTASAAASMVPTVTGVPGASPVSAAARRVTSPAISVVQASSGSIPTSTMPSARSSLQARRATS